LRTLVSDEEGSNHMPKVTLVALWVSGLIVVLGAFETALAQNGGPAVGASFDPNVLAFGLDRLHWDMSPAKVKAVYPKITSISKNPGTYPLMNLGTLYYDEYEYAGCTFDGVLRFDDGKLKTVEFSLSQSVPNPPNNRPCIEPMEKEFSARYGVPVEYHTANSGHDRNSIYLFDGRYGRYRGPETTANYENTTIVEFSFSDAAHPPKNVIIYNIQPPATQHH
jgi:hypothetical protein